MQIELIRQFAKKQGYDSAKKLFEWNGYIVYEPLFESDVIPVVGLPFCILERNNEIRMSTEEEAFDILDTSPQQ